MDVWLDLKIKFCLVCPKYDKKRADSLWALCKLSCVYFIIY